MEKKRWGGGGGESKEEKERESNTEGGEGLLTTGSRLISLCVRVLKTVCVCVCLCACLKAGYRVNVREVEMVGVVCGVEGLRVGGAGRVRVGGEGWGGGGG